MQLKNTPTPDSLHTSLSKAKPPRESGPMKHRENESDGSSPSERYVIPNLRNACRILKLLDQQPEGIKTADLARTLKIPVTSTLRIMATLHLEGFVRKEEGRYQLGPVLIQLGHSALSRTEIRDLATPLLRRLSEITAETAHLAIPCDNRSLIVAVHDSPHPIRASSRPGFLAELHCSSTGKIFLAFLHRDRIADVLPKRPLPRRTEQTLVTLDALESEANLTFERGYSLDNEEFHTGVRCIAAPVFASDGKVVAALGITASTIRFTPDRVPQMASMVTKVADELSLLLGFPGSDRSEPA